MKGADVSHDWVAAHLFFPSDIYGAWADDVIRDIVTPFVRTSCARGWIRTWFFIRYSEQGPHLRLRFSGEAKTLAAEVQPAFEEHIRDRNPAVRVGMPALGSAEQESRALRSGEITHVVWCPYEKEVERYGGTKALIIAEDLFHHSSEFVSASIPHCLGEDRSRRLGCALLATLTAFHTFFETREAVAKQAENCRIGYLRTKPPSVAGRPNEDAFDHGFAGQSADLIAYLREAWERLENREPMTEELDMLRRRLEEARDRVEALCVSRQFLVKAAPVTYAVAARAVVPSYVHMTSNRLGVSVIEEAYLAHLICRALPSALSNANSGNQD